MIRYLIAVLITTSLLPCSGCKTTVNALIDAVFSPSDEYEQRKEEQRLRYERQHAYQKIEQEAMQRE